MNKEEIQESEYEFPYHYLDLASALHKYVNIEYKLFIQKVAEGIPKNSTVLDLGCGDGRLAYELKDKAYYYGVDGSEQAINFAKAFNPGKDFECDNLLFFQPKMFYDYVMMIEVLEHLNPHDVKDALSKAYECLQKKGTLVITVPSDNVPVQEKHYQHFNIKQLRALLESNFEIREEVGLQARGYSLYEFRILAFIGSLLLPFKRRFKFNKYYALLEKQYRLDVLTCHYSEGKQIMMVCTKK